MSCQSQEPGLLSKHLYRARNLVERFFNKINQFRRIAIRYDKLTENFLAALKFAAVRIWLRNNESTAHGAAGQLRSAANLRRSTKCSNLHDKLPHQNWGVVDLKTRENNTYDLMYMSPLVWYR